MALPRFLQRIFANNGAGPKLLGSIIPFGSAAPKAPGTASAGSADEAARADHVHPAQTIPGNMKGATASTAGTAGLVPAPAAGTQVAKYLRADGTWQTPPDTNTTYSAATQSAQGLMTAADKTKLDGIAAGAQVNPAAATAAPKAPGTASVGISVKYAREDHVHPDGNHVKKTGDIMTGNLVIEHASPSITFKETDVDSTNINEGTHVGSYVYVQDKNGNDAGRLSFGGAADYRSAMLRAHCGDINAEIIVYAKKDGTIFATGPTPPASSSSLAIINREAADRDYVKKAGDTMTGDLVLSNSNVHIDHRQYVLGGKVTTATDLTAVYSIRDREGVSIANMTSSVLAEDSSTVLNLFTSNVNIYNEEKKEILTTGIKLRAYRDGAKSALLSMTTSEVESSAAANQLATTGWVKSKLPGNMKGATASVAGTAGLVPAPAAGTQATKYLRADGTWQTPPHTTYSAATQSAQGLMSAADKKKLDGFIGGMVPVFDLNDPIYEGIGIELALNTEYTAACNGYIIFSAYFTYDAHVEWAGDIWHKVDLSGAHLGNISSSDDLRLHHAVIIPVAKGQKMWMKSTGDKKPTSVSYRFYAAK